MVTDSVDAGPIVKVPGGRIVGWLAVLVPACRRSEWLTEWRSELAHSFEESQATNTPRMWLALRLRLRASGAVRDALWLRRASGGGGRMRETWREAARVLRRQLPSERYPEEAQRTAFHRALDQRLRALPGVQDLSWNRSGVPPDIGFLEPVAPEAEGGASIAVASGVLPWAVVDSAYFSVMRTPIVQGRTFNASDLLPGANSVVIDIDLATALWPDGEAVGKRFRAGRDREWLTVAGVSGDVKLGGIDDGLGEYALFEPTSIDKLRGPQLVIRTTRDAAALPGLIRETIREMDPLLPIGSITTAEELLHDSIQERRFVLTTMTAFAVVALILAAIGVYGLVAFSVARRTRGIGIRKAIGARDGQIVGAVFARGLAIAAGGLVLGLMGTAVLSRLLTALLFGVPRHDPFTLMIVTVVLLLACATALIVPARRAARVDAASALRVE